MAVLKVPYRVIFGDTDALGIVYYANYLRLMDLARSEWFRKFSLPPRVMYEEKEYMIVIVETHLQHKRPARFDEMIEIEIWLNKEWIKPASIRFDYRIWSESGDLCVQGYTRHAFTDRSGALKRPPRDYLASLQDVAELKDYNSNA